MYKIKKKEKQDLTKIVKGGKTSSQKTVFEIQYACFYLTPYSVQLCCHSIFLFVESVAVYTLTLYVADLQKKEVNGI